MLAALVFLLVCTGGAPQAAGSELALTFETPRSGGRIVVAVFDSRDGWRRRGDPVSTAYVTGRSHVIRGLKPGRYGIMAYHDVNDDGRLNTLPIGLPTEPYGFSQNARGMFGPPDWSAAAFQVGDGRTAQVIRLR